MCCGGLERAHLRRRDEGVRSGVSVVPGGEVPVEGRDDGVLLSLLHVAPESSSGTRRQGWKFNRSHVTESGADTCPTVRCRVRRR